MIIFILNHIIKTLQTHHNLELGTDSEFCTTILDHLDQITNHTYATTCHLDSLLGSGAGRFKLEIPQKTQLKTLN